MLRPLGEVVRVDAALLDVPAQRPVRDGDLVPREQELAGLAYRVELRCSGQREWPFVVGADAACRSPWAGAVDGGSFRADCEAVSPRPPSRPFTVENHTVSVGRRHSGLTGYRACGCEAGRGHRTAPAGLSWLAPAPARLFRARDLSVDYLFPLARLCGMQSISQLLRSLFPPFDQAVTWSASISSSL